MFLRRFVILLLLATTCLVSGLLAQPSDSLSPEGEEVVISLNGIMGLEWVNKDVWGGRFYMGLPVVPILYLPVTTFSLTHSAADGKTRASMNPLFLIPMAIALKSLNGDKGWLYVAILALPELVGNPSLQIPILKGHLFLTASQRTDYYLFSEGSKIYTESALGLRVRIGRLSGEIRYAWPLTKGYLLDKGPYIGASFYFGG